MTKRLTPIETYELMVDRDFGRTTPFEPGQHRLYVHEQANVVMVKLVAINKAGAPDTWWAFDILDPHHRIGKYKTYHLSTRVYNDMEVLAWSAR